LGADVANMLLAGVRDVRRNVRFALLSGLEEPDLRQLLIESVVLSIAGGLFGWLVAVVVALVDYTTPSATLHEAGYGYLSCVPTASESNPRNPPTATSHPNRPPAMDRTTLSMRSWRRIRALPAPDSKANRHFLRTSHPVRAAMFATSAHAIRRTNPDCGERWRTGDACCKDRDFRRSGVHRRKVLVRSRVLRSQPSPTRPPPRALGQVGAGRKAAEHHQTPVAALF